jgi:PilZ domain
MTLNFVSPQAITSVSQRALADHWDRLAAGRRFPSIGELKPDPDMHDPKQLVVWNIEGEGSQRKFRALYQGENVAEAFNSAWAGKTMEQVVPMSLRRLTLDAAKECATTGCLVYMVFSTIDANDQRVSCQRLLLPFGNDGSKVEQILASLQLTSVPSRKRILNHFRLQAEVHFSGKIESGFTSAKPQSKCVSNIAAAPTKRPGVASGESRRAARRSVRRTARISFANQSVTCMVRNISATGASIEVTNLAEIPDNFRLIMEMESTERRCTVVWRKKTQIGIRFK